MGDQSMTKAKLKGITMTFTTTINALTTKVTTLSTQVNNNAKNNVNNNTNNRAVKTGRAVRASPFSPINFRAWALNIEPEF